MGPACARRFGDWGRTPRPEHRGRNVTARIEHRTAQRPDEVVGLAGDDEVHPVKALVRHPTHLAFAVSAPEHRHDRRIQLPDAPQQRERRALLLEHRAASDDPRPVCEYSFRHVIDESACHFADALELLAESGWIAEGRSERS